MRRGAWGTFSMCFKEMAGFTPYQHGGGSTPATRALSEVVPPIEPETHSTTGTSICSSAHSTRRTVSSVVSALPQAWRWKLEEASAKPSRIRELSHGLSMRSLTLPPWPWNQTTRPLGAPVPVGSVSRTGSPLRLLRMTEPAIASLGTPLGATVNRVVMTARIATTATRM